MSEEDSHSALIRSEKDTLSNSQDTQDDISNLDHLQQQQQQQQQHDFRHHQQDEKHQQFDQNDLPQQQVQQQSLHEQQQQQQPLKQSVKNNQPQVKPPSKNDQNKRQRAYMKLLIILWSVFGIGLFSSFLFLIASMTEDWAILIPPNPYFISTNQKFMFEWRRGLWRDCMLECNEVFKESKNLEWQCIGRDFFPTSEAVVENNEIDHYILDYERSVAAFSVITLVISSLPLFFTWYSIKEPRYIFKRLAGGLYFITAGCAIVCIEVFKHFLEYGRRYLPNSLMRVADYQRGYSYYLACISVGLYIFVGIVIFIVSGKKKGLNARSFKEAVENEPVIIGRL